MSRDVMDRVDQYELEAAGQWWYAKRGERFEDPPVPRGACIYCEGAGCPDCRRDRGQASARGIVAVALWSLSLLAVLAYGPDVVCAVNGGPASGISYCLPEDAQ